MLEACGCQKSLQAMNAEGEGGNRETHPLIRCGLFARASDGLFAGRLAQDSLEPERDLEVCFCALRHAAGGMPNWVMNQRVKELAIE